MKRKKKSTIRILYNKLLFEDDGKDASFCETCMSVHDVAASSFFYFLFHFFSLYDIFCLAFSVSTSNWKQLIWDECKNFDMLSSWTQCNE